MTHPTYAEQEQALNEIADSLDVTLIHVVDLSSPGHDLLRYTLRVSGTLIQPTAVRAALRAVRSIEGGVGMMAGRVTRVQQQQQAGWGFIDLFTVTIECAGWEHGRQTPRPDDDPEDRCEHCGYVPSETGTRASDVGHDNLCPEYVQGIEPEPVDCVGFVPASVAPKGRRAYVVQAGKNGGQFPTFYLLADVQGITSTAAAERVARTILSFPPNSSWDGLNQEWLSVEETTLP